MKFKKGFKYQLQEDELIHCVFTKPLRIIETDYCIFRPSGDLHVHKRYAWDGPSGPTIDTDNSMTPSLGHDVLAQLMRERILPQTCRLSSNLDFYNWCLDRKMNKMRAWFWRKTLDKLGAPSTRPENKKEIYEVN